MAGRELAEALTQSTYDSDHLTVYLSRSLQASVTKLVTIENTHNVSASDLFLPLNFSGSGTPTQLPITFIE